MAFSLKELSIFGGKPEEFYEIITPSTTYYYTSSKGDKLLVPSQPTKVYRAVYIDRTEIQQEVGKVTDSGVVLTVDKTLDFLNEFRVIVPARSVLINIKRKHRGDDGNNPANIELVFTGRIRGVVPKQDVTEVICESFGTSVKRAGLRLGFQVGCNYFVYDSGCGVSSAAYAVSGTALDIDDAVVTCPEASAYVDGYFNNGYLEYGNYFYHIVNHVGDTLTLLTGLEGALEGDSVTIYPGCDGSLNTCWDKFNRGLDHGGFPFSPADDIYTEGL
jgi:hypothetical protein